LITPKNKTIFTLAALGFLIIHFTATFFYVAPPSWTGERFKNYSNYYMLPLFHQSWSLFAPSPPMVNKKVNLKIMDEKGNINTEILFDDFIKWHDKVRMGASGRFVMLRGNTLHSVYATYEHLKSTVKDPFIRLSQFRSSATGKTYRHLVKNWVEYKYPELKNENYKVESEIVFENYKNYILTDKYESDTLKITYGFKNK